MELNTSEVLKVLADKNLKEYLNTLMRSLLNNDTKFSPFFGGGSLSIKFVQALICTPYIFFLYLRAENISKNPIA
jgi:hypothetical protein